MLAVRHHPELATPRLWAWLRPRAGRYEGGRASCWLCEGGPLPPELEAVALAVCPDVDPDAWAKVGLQCYRDGRAATECHTDAGATGFGFILSLGATRTFRVHRVPDGVRPQEGCGEYGLDARAIECAAGTAVLMDEAFHARWHHEIPPEPGATGARLSLVFRTRPTA